MGTELGLVSTGLLPKCPEQSGLGKAEARSPELHQGLPHGWQGPNSLSHPLQEAGLDMEWPGLKPGTAPWDKCVPNG